VTSGLPDRYRVVRTLGRGTFATVALAVDTATGASVACKVLDGPVLADENVRRRLEREWTFLRSIDHRNVVRVIDVVVTPTAACLVMEYLDGARLDEMLERRSFTPSEAAAMAIQLAEGLAAIHEAGIVHRDVKPANVMVAGDGRAVLMDFNLAYSADLTALTATGMYVGTPRYMAPELLDGGEPSPAVDVYAWGLILHELLVGPGKLPAFGGPPPRPSSVDARIPAAFDDIVATATATAPSKRYGRSSDAAEAVRRCTTLAATAPPPPPMPEPSHGPRLAALATMTVIAASMAALLLLPPRHGAVRELRPLPSPVEPTASERLAPLHRSVDGLRERRAFESCCARVFGGSRDGEDEVEQDLGVAAAMARSADAAALEGTLSGFAARRLFADLCYLWQFDMLATAHGRPERLAWRPGPTSYVTLTVADGNGPWLLPAATGAHVVAFSGSEQRLMDSVLATSGGAVTSLYSTFSQVQARREAVVELDEAWLAAAGPRATVAVRVALCPPKQCLSFGINSVLEIPLWVPKREPKAPTEHIFRMGVPSALLQRGTNRFTVRLSALTRDMTIEHAFVKEVYVMHGPW